MYFNFKLVFSHKSQIFYQSIIILICYLQFFNFYHLLLYFYYQMNNSFQEVDWNHQPPLPFQQTNHTAKQQQSYQHFLNKITKQQTTQQGVDNIKQLSSYSLYPYNQQILFLFKQKLENSSNVIREFFNKYRPYNPKIIQHYQNQFSLLRLSTNAIYIGQVFNGKAQGFGIVIFDDMRIYQGFLQNNIRQGQGLYVQRNHSWYYGQFVNDKKDGFGLYVTQNYTYQGNFVNGIKHGNGILICDTFKYRGQWRMDNITGKGYLESSQSKYDGYFQNFSKHGYGYEIFNNGDIYRGYYFNGKQQGQGQYKWFKQKCIYKGNFKDGKRTGKGVWQNKKGDKFIGNYKQDLKNDYGQFYWKSGNVYKGNYVNDIRHGYGQMYWYDGTVYKGEWCKGVQHGKGQLHLTTQEVLNGLFDNNMLISHSPPLQQINYTVNNNKSMNKNNSRLNMRSVPKRRSELINIKQSFQLNNNGLSEQPSKMKFRHNFSEHPSEIIQSKQKKIVQRDLFAQKNTKDIKKLYINRKPRTSSNFKISKKSLGGLTYNINEIKTKQHIKYYMKNQAAQHFFQF